MYSKEMRLVKILCEVVRDAENQMMTRYPQAVSSRSHLLSAMDGINLVRKNLVSSLAAEYPDMARNEIERLTRANKAL